MFVIGIILITLIKIYLNTTHKEIFYLVLLRYHELYAEHPATLVENGLLKDSAFQLYYVQM